MYDRVIWPENYDPKTSAIYALNDIDVKPMKIRIIIAATCAALDFSMAGRWRVMNYRCRRLPTHSAA